MQYRFVPCSVVPHLPRQLAALSNLAFAEYEGAPEADAEFIAWYLDRPGSGPDLCLGALTGEELVSSVLIAMQDVNLGGEYVRCGIIDTVATHPDHRQRGLARTLMERAHERIRQAGGQAAVLYTNPANHPYHFYGRLGYLTRSQASLLTGPRPTARGDCLVSAVEPAAAADLRAMVNGVYGDYEGFARLDDDLWAWHRQRRPAHLPVVLLAAHRAGNLVGTVAVATTDVLLHGQRQSLGFVSDVVAPDADCLRDLLAAAPVADLAALHDARAPLTGQLQMLGWSAQVGEVAMVLPLADRVGELLSDTGRPWYVMVESVVGV